MDSHKIQMLTHKCGFDLKPIVGILKRKAVGSCGRLAALRANREEETGECSTYSNCGCKLPPSHNLCERALL
jgi:hypothetical protein